MVDGKKVKQTNLNLDEVKKLIEMLEKSKLEELDVSYGDVHLRMVKPKDRQVVTHMAPPSSTQTGSSPAGYQPAPAAQNQPDAPPLEPVRSSTTVEVKSPMVGTFYRAPAPNAEVFVKVGDAVKKGQTLCIIEAMKLMNEIECEADGKVVAIKVQNAEPVEYGEVLMLIDTAV